MKSRMRKTKFHFSPSKWRIPWCKTWLDASLHFLKCVRLFMACFAHSFGMRVIFGVPIFQNIQMGSNAFCLPLSTFAHCTFHCEHKHTHRGWSVGGGRLMPLRSAHYRFYEAKTMKMNQPHFSDFYSLMADFCASVLPFRNSLIRLTAFVRKIRECGRGKKIRRHRSFPDDVA